MADALSIPQRLSSLGDVDSHLSGVLTSFGDISNLAKSFSPSDLPALLKAGAQFPLPDSLALISPTLQGLATLAEKLPSNPSDLTGSLEQLFNALKASVLDVVKQLAPVSGAIALIGPLLDKAELIEKSVTRINTVFTDLSSKANGLTLTQLPQQLEYISRIFDSFPEAAQVPQVQELKQQIDTIKAWLTLNSSALSTLFHDQIQSLASALPTQIEAAAQQGLSGAQPLTAAVNGIKRPLWFEPYHAALTTLAGLNVSDTSRIVEFRATVQQQLDSLKPKTQALTTATDNAAQVLVAFDARGFALAWKDSLQNILGTVSREHPGMLATVFSQVTRTIATTDRGAIREQVKKLEFEINARIGDIDVSNITDKIDTVTNQIVSTVGAVDRGLIELATHLSSLVNEAQDLIASVDLAGLVSGIHDSLQQVSDAVATVRGQIEAVRTQIEGFVTQLGTEIQKLDPAVVGQAIADLLAQITGILDDPAVKQVREQAQNAIAEIAEKLKELSLTPVFDATVAEIDELKEKVSKIDVSQLNEALKATLHAALDILRGIDFANAIAGELTKDFDKIVDESVKIVKPLQDQFKVIENKIDTFEPGKIVSEKLTPPFELLVAELGKVRPAKALEPLKQLQTQLTVKLQPLSPEVLLQPLIDMHKQLISAVELLSPAQLIAPLNAILSDVTHVLDELGIEALVARINDSVGKITGFITNSPIGSQVAGESFGDAFKQVPAKIEGVVDDLISGVDGFLDKLVASVGSVDIAVVKPAFDALHTGVQRIETLVKTPDVVTLLDQVIATVEAQHFSDGVSDLTKLWLEQKARFLAIAPPAQSAADAEALKELVRQLSPLVLLSEATTSVDELLTALRAARDTVSRAQTAMVHSLEEQKANLDSLFPTEMTAAGFANMLRGTLDEQIGAPIKDMLRIIKKRITELNDAWVVVINVALKVAAPFKALTIGTASITKIGNALIDAKNKITGVNLNFLADELQGVLDAVKTQLLAVDPATAIAQLQSIFESAIAALGDLYPEEAINQLDEIYKTVVVQKIALLHPSKIVGPPIQKEYEKIIQLRKDLSVDGIFEPLDGKLTTLKGELDEGLKRSASKLTELVAALPV